MMLFDKPVEKKLYKDIDDILVSTQSVIEFLAVYHGVKPAMRTHVTYNQLRDLQEICKTYNLYCTIQEYKIIPIADKHKRGYHNQGKRVALSYPKGDFIVYVGKTYESVMQAKSSDMIDDIRFGQAMGYPMCCIKQYVATRDAQEQCGQDFVSSSYSGFGTFSFYTNNCLRYFEIGVLSHFPCTYRCQSSIEQVKRFLRVLNAYHPALAAFFVDQLQCCVVYSNWQGVLYTKDYIFKNNVFTLHTFQASDPNSALAKNMLQHKQIVIQKNNFQIGETVYSDDDIHVLLFK